MLVEHNFDYVALIGVGQIADGGQRLSSFNTEGHGDLTPELHDEIVIEILGRCGEALEVQVIEIDRDDA